MTGNSNSNKVIVFTLGTGGRKTAEIIHQYEQEHEPNLEIEYVPIESTSFNSNSLPNEFEGIPLDTNDRIKKEFEQAKEDPTVPFLSLFHNLHNEGATRNPAVGRFLLERHDKRVKKSIRNTLQSTLTRQDSEASIWLVATGSGGTGAGMLPLVAPMVREAANGVQSKFNLDIYVNAMVTVSELRTDGQELDPEGSAEYYVNSSNTLQALASLQSLKSSGFDSEEERPDLIETPIASTMDSIDIGEPPLDGLFIAPMEEQNAEESRWDGDKRNSYLAQVNFKLASTLLGLSSVSADDDMGNLYNKLSDGFYTIDATQVRATVEEAKELLDSEDAIRQGRTDLNKLESHVSDIKDMAETLEKIQEADFDPGEIPDSVEEISNEVAGRASQFVKDTSALDLTEAGFEEIERSISRIVSDIPAREASEDQFENDLQRNSPADFEPEQFIPHKLIGKYVFQNQILARVEAELEDHPFEERIEELWEKNENNLDSEVAGLSNSDPQDKYKQALDPYLASWENDIETKLSKTSWLKHGKRKRLKQQLQEIRETREELQALFREFDRLESLKERISDAELPALETEFNSVETLLEDRQDTGERLVSEKQNRIQTLENTRDAYSGRVSPTDNFHRSVGDIPLDVTSSEDLSRQSLDDTDNLFDLIDAGLLDRDTILQQIATGMDIISEPLEDSFAEDSFDSESLLNRILIPMTSPDNSRVLTMEGESRNGLGSIKSRNDVDEMLSLSKIDAPFAVTFVMLHGNVTLANASEFRVVQEQWEQGTLQRLLGSDIELPQYNAYPELVPSVPAPTDQYIVEAASASSATDRVSGE
ncbi:tubulin-like doman-containing protein [Natronoglomus mannanivorans]|uniref:Tubulin like n=1 Tax=Natronoglomus mannanivorans TaxID=2979990 RepID=A0AAP3E4I9_9EURY|nr:hypothetical protein [Halobacteria archaeon AArc-xg1-1]